MSKITAQCIKDIVGIQTLLSSQQVEEVGAEPVWESLEKLEKYRSDLSQEFFEDLQDGLATALENITAKAQSQPSTSVKTISQFDTSLLTNQDFFLTPQIPKPTKKRKAAKRRTTVKVAKAAEVATATDDCSQELFQTQSQSQSQSQSLEDIPIVLAEDMDICTDLPETATVVEETPEAVPLEEEEAATVVDELTAKITRRLQKVDLAGTIDQLGDVIDDVAAALPQIRELLLQKAQQVEEARVEKPQFRVKTVKKYNPFYDETTEVTVVEKIPEEPVDYHRGENWLEWQRTREYLRKLQWDDLHALRPQCSYSRPKKIHKK